MQVDNSLISRLETLAKLRLSEEERETIKNDLSRILEMIQKLEGLDTEGVEPLRYLVERPVGGRIDQIGKMNEAKEAVKNAPASADSFFTVPKVIKH